MDRPGFGEFANTPSGIHLQKPNSKQKKARMNMDTALNQFNKVDSEIKNDDLFQLKKDFQELKKIIDLKINLIDEKLSNTNQINISENKWRKIKYGMKQNQVREILGEPITIQCMYERERWSYIHKSDMLYEVNNGDVEFDPYDNKLTSWKEPL